MKMTLIFLSCFAGILAIFAYIAVFGNPSGTYTVTAMGSPPSSVTTSTLLTATTTASSTSSSSTVFTTSFSPAAVSWHTGQSEISLTGATLNGNQLTFTFSIALGSSPECVPLNLRLVADEEGDLQPPNPASFSFPDSGNCNGAAGETYTNQSTTFIVDPTAFPLLFNAQDDAKTFFEVATTSAGGIQIQLPANAD